MLNPCRSPPLPAIDTGDTAFWPSASARPRSFTPSTLLTTQERHSDACHPTEAGEDETEEEEALHEFEVPAQVGEFSDTDEIRLLDTPPEDN